jgi:hypothetical protein
VQNTDDLDVIAVPIVKDQVVLESLDRKTAQLIEVDFRTTNS